jgi:hypothetical protein
MSRFRVSRSLAASAVVGVLFVAGSALARRPPLVPSSQHYRERNPSAATGRSGTAVVSSRALRSRRTGDVSLEVATGALDGNWPYPVGTLAGIQVKALRADGSLERTTVLDGVAGTSSVVVSPAPLGSGGAYQLQARVRGADGARTDVVTTEGAVRIRPDLGITFDGPTRVPVDAATTLTATVSNPGTDVGATATCRLYVGGSTVPSDEAWGVWVDGGDQVSCVFSHVFDQLGPQSIRVAVENVVPADDFAGNDSATAVVDVVGNPTPEVTWLVDKSRAVYDAGFERSNGYTTFTLPGGSSWGSEWDYRYDLVRSGNESTSLWLLSATRVTFPLQNLDVSFASGGASLFELHEQNLAADYEWQDGASGGSWLSLWDDASRTMVYVQTSYSERDVNTSLSAQRMANQVTYWATGYTRTWWSSLPGGDVVTYYTPRDDRLGTFSAQLDETATLVALDGAGRVFEGGGTVTLQSEERTMSVPLTCYDDSRPTYLGYMTSHACVESMTHAVFSNGQITGTSGGF